MMSSLSVLGKEGDTRIVWDPNDPEDCERARATVAALKASGFTFFLVDGREAGEVNGGGNGTLVVRKLAADEVVPDPPADDAGPAPEGEATEAADPPKKRRGRPPKARAEGQNVVAVRPVRGG